MRASHVVVDTRDGYTWTKDHNGYPFTYDTASDFAMQRNAERRPPYRTYKVYRLTEVAALRRPDKPLQHRAGDLRNRREGGD